MKIETTRPASNRKPADALADVRAEIAILKAREQELRAGFISGILPLDGDDFTVTVTTSTIERIDLKTMRQHVDETIWAPFLISKLTPYVRATRKPLSVTPSVTGRSVPMTSGRAER